MSKPRAQAAGASDAPILRHELIGSVHQEIERLIVVYPELVSIQDSIHNAADEILRNLPKMVSACGHIITRRCRVPTDEAIVNLSRICNGTDGEEGNIKAQESLSDLRKKICAHVMLIIKREHIQRIVTEIQQYQSKHEPVPWTLGSVRFYGETTKGSKLYTFKIFWQNNIEEDGDVFFRQHIVSKLSPQWQEKFVSTKSPHRWSTMGNEEIANKISLLKTRRDPAKYRWNFASIQAWEGENGEALGRGFSGTWKNVHKADYEEKFRELILPHLPEKWRENYISNKVKHLTRKGPYIWAMLSVEETVAVLISLKKLRNPERTKWSFGSTKKWTHEDGKKVGISFFIFLRNKYGTEIDKKFREIYLPHFPPAWRETYCEKKHKITFVSSSTDSKTANEEDDLNRLVALAQGGNRLAYEKALSLAIQFLPDRFSNVVGAADFIERLIHIHLPALGSFKAYLVVSAATKRRGMSYTRSMDAKPYLHDRGLGINDKARAEDAFLEKLEPPRSSNEALIAALQELELSPSFLELLSEEIIAGRSLAQLMENEDSGISDAARKINAILVSSLE